ncbi:MAG TPA: 2Fe-2S iron-sulfur cluster-binding protein, partial [Alphaproteobacteria bacterium]|nr:2Fe-2S iron-sulfur cluster-binding protein [Alphaproteobacteria bacterium]
MLRLFINGKPVEASTGATLLDCVHAARVEVPTLCHHPRLRPYGGCRLCMVQVDDQPHLVAACATPASDGMSIRTHTPQIERQRKTLLGLLAEHY